VLELNDLEDIVVQDEGQPVPEIAGIDQGKRSECPPIKTVLG
jgi:hypothetical protein